MKGKERLLLIDTCGETAGIALSIGQKMLITEELAWGSTSVEIVSTVRRLLEQVNWRLAELDAVGVVNGPGSFTGMRAGLATAKGLCEAAGLPLIAVSRLEVLADAASLQDGFVALDAGRGELYVREQTIGREWLCSSGNLATLAKENQTSSAPASKECALGTQAFGSDKKKGKSIVIAEVWLAECLAGYEIVLYPLHVGDALSVVLRRLCEEGSDVSLNVSLIDANYVREERDIYRKQANIAKPARVEA
jgi:tRNA threonylcarbamoyladenosine biosynthesis protein TsaB